MLVCLKKRYRKTILKRQEQIEGTGIKDVIGNFRYISVIYLTCIQATCSDIWI